MTPPLSRDTAGDLGGFKLGSAFFGWLIATGMSALLAALAIAIASLAGAGITRADLSAVGDIDGPLVGIVLLLVLALSYFAGGYVAGRLARFQGARAGFGVWAIAGLLTLLLAALGALLGSQFNLLAQVELPRLTLGSAGLALGGVGALVVSSGITLVAAVAGGHAGERYHARIDARLER
jgi:hypothetical protein